MTRTVTYLKVSKETSDLLAPKEFQLQKELIGRLQRDIQLFIEENKDQGPSIYATVLSSFATLFSSLASYLELDYETTLEMFASILKEGLKKDA